MTDNLDIELVTMNVGEAQFGIPVLKVRDVLDSPATYPIPLAPREIAGSINLRGRIVTAIDLRVRLGLPPRAPGSSSKCIIVDSESAGECYAFLVDDVGEVLKVFATAYDRIQSRCRNIGPGSATGSTAATTACCCC